MTDKTTPSTSSDKRPPTRRRVWWWGASAAAVLALVAAAFVTVPRLTGNGPEAEAATNSWQNACADKLAGGTITRNPVRGGFTLECVAGMEAYVGKSPGTNQQFALVPRDAAACILVRMDPVFISDAEFDGVVDVFWNPYRGWDPKPGEGAPGQPTDDKGQGGALKGDPGGYANPFTIEPAAGVLQGKRADGSIAWEHQYGSNVQVGSGVPRCKAPVR